MCGYYSPHANDEIVSINDVWDTYDTICEIFTSIEEKRWEHKYKHEPIKYASNGNYKKLGSQLTFDDFPIRRDMISNFNGDRGTYWANGKAHKWFNGKWTPVDDLTSQNGSKKDTNVITDDPREVNSYLNDDLDRDTPKDSSFSNLSEDEVEVMTDEEIELWEEVMISKADFDSALDDYVKFKTKQLEVMGRI